MEEIHATFQTSLLEAVEYQVVGLEAEHDNESAIDVGTYNKSKTSCYPVFCGHSVG